MNPALTVWPPTLISGDMPNDLVPGSDGGLKATFTIAANSITNALLRDSAGLSVIGRAANSAGDPADITATTDHHVLRRSGTTIGWGPINLGQANATTGQLPVNKGGTGRSTLTSGSYLTGNGTAAVALRTPAQVWSDIGPTARATTQTWTAAQTFSAVSQSAGNRYATREVTVGQTVTLGITDEYVYISSFAAGVANVYLPASPVPGQRYVFMCLGAAGTVTIHGNGRTIDGGPTSVPINNGQRMELVYFAHSANCWLTAGS